MTHDPEKLQIVTSNMRKWHSRMAISREQLDRWLSVAEVTLLQLGAEAPLVAEVVHHLAAIFGHFSHSLEAGDAVERSPPPLAKIFCQEDTETRRSKDFRESYPM